MIDWTKVITKEDKFEQMRQAKFDEIKQERRFYEDSGITFNGFEVKTDLASQNKIIAVAVMALQDPSYKCKWKMANGFVELNAEQIVEIAQAVREHVQSAFDREAELIPLIESAKNKTELNKIKWEVE